MSDDSPFEHLAIGYVTCLALRNGFACVANAGAIDALVRDKNRIVGRRDASVFLASIAAMKRTAGTGEPQSPAEPIVIRGETGHVLALTVRTMTAIGETKRLDMLQQVTRARRGCHLQMTPERGAKEPYVGLYVGRDREGIVTYVARSQAQARAAMETFEACRGSGTDPFPTARQRIAESPLDVSGKSGSEPFAVRGQMGAVLMLLAMFPHLKIG